LGVGRKEPPCIIKEPKKFLQRRPLPGGGYAWDRGDTPEVLYRLPDLIKFPDATVFFCEGEKDADRVAAFGLVATTVSGSAADKWTPELAEPLAGATCSSCKTMT
jgi:hypothetical protein